MAVRGGHRLRAAIRKGLSAQGVTRVTVGFYRTAKYPDGTPVAAVAAWNEFGTKGGGWGGPIPERPFFRTAIRLARDDIRQLLRERVDPQRMVVDDKMGNELGALVASQIQRTIAEAKFKAPAAATLAARKRPGFRGRATPYMGAKPLNVEGILRTSVSWQVERT